MRRTLRGAVGLAAVGILALAALPSGAAPAAERQLLGIRIWRSWREVLAKHGQPTRIEIGAVTSATGGGQEGGGPGMPGMPGAPMMGGPGGGPMLPGLTGMGMGPGAPMASGMTSGGMGAPMMGGMRGKGGAMMGGGPTAPGAGNPYAGYGSGAPMLPGMPGAGPMASGSSMGSGMPPMMGSAMPPMMGGGMPPMGGFGAGQGSVSSEPEVTWIYEKGANTNYFLFNKDGRVIQIQAFGYKGTASTTRGLRLGDPVSRVYRVYGWPDSSTRAGDNLTLDYSRKAHAAFQCTDLKDGKGARVVGITVALTEKGNI